MVTVPGNPALSQVLCSQLLLERSQKAKQRRNTGGVWVRCVLDSVSHRCLLLPFFSCRSLKSKNIQCGNAFRYCKNCSLDSAPGAPISDSSQHASQALALLQSLKRRVAQPIQLRSPSSEQIHASVKSHPLQLENQNSPVQCTVARLGKSDAATRSLMLSGLHEGLAGCLVEHVCSSGRAHSSEFTLVLDAASGTC